MEKAVCGPRLCTGYQRGWARAARWGEEGGRAVGSPPNKERRGSSASLGCLFEAGENGVGGHEWRSVGLRLCESSERAADGPSGCVGRQVYVHSRGHTYRERGTSLGAGVLGGP